jgi:hypothetical protein
MTIQWVIFLIALAFAIDTPIECLIGPMMGWWDPLHLRLD